MHVVVIGAGVLGVTTAYYLSEFDCEVTVVDRAADVAEGASFANAGQLSYSFTGSIASPRFIAKIPGIISGRDPGHRVQLTPDLIPWGLRFLSQCTGRNTSKNTLAILKLAMRSEQLMAELRRRLPFDFSHRKAGKLMLLSSKAAVSEARARVSLKTTQGCDTKLISRAAAIELEPAIDSMAVDCVAAVYSRNDAVGDSHAFTQGMRKMLETSHRVQFRLGVEAQRLVKKNQRLTSVVLDDGELSADAVVICTGAWSGGLLKSVAIDPRIYPVRGYSITLPIGTAAPNVSITVSSRKFVFSRINGKIRIAGFADFQGFRETDDARRTDELLQVAREVAPLAADYEADGQLRWGGFRPMTPNGRPCVGPSKVEGLFLNTGHGMLGWTLACASSHDIAHAVAWHLR